MPKKIEYKFVRVGEGMIFIRPSALAEYRYIIEDHAREGWRLVQVFAPPMGIYGHSRFFELIFERVSEG